MATNFKTTLKTLEADFESRSGYKLDLISGSTGKLYAQIVNGAPYDVFLAADQARPARLVAEGHAVAASRFTYAIGMLALWSPGHSDVTADTLIEPNITRLALANPDLAPYGLAALQVLERILLDEELRPKFVFGENVGQTFAFVSTGNAQIGFVSAAQVLARPEDAEGSAWFVPPQLHEPIAQDAVLLRRGEENGAARAFLTYLESEPAREIIRRSGYESD
ncbi:MAG: molybdate ABC transporter substrate-binding protein [Pseudomonadota bacterium]